MPKEHEGQPVPLSAIHINLKERSIMFEAEEQVVAKLTFASSGTILFQAQPSSVGERAHEPPAPSTDLLTESTLADREREPTVIVTGRLRSKPREGKADRSSNPTAWARLAVYEEGRGVAHLYLATFHRHAAKVALTLPKEAQITVEGYPHPSQDEKRLDTFSVVNVVNYPGRPQKR